jgi:hypothetical protein
MVNKQEFYMKNFLKLLGIIALSMVIAFSMAACGDGEEEEEEPGPAGSANPDLIGTWVDEYTLEYVITAHSTNASMVSLSFQSTMYSITVAGNKLTYDFMGTPVGSANFSIAANKNTLTISNSDDFPMHDGEYTRKAQ